MTALMAFVLLAAASTGGPSPMPAFAPTKSVAPAQVSVRILSGAKISLSAAAQPEGYEPKRALITLEDGTRREARLVEFQ